MHYISRRLGHKLNAIAINLIWKWIGKNITKIHTSPYVYRNKNIYLNEFFHMC